MQVDQKLCSYIYNKISVADKPLALEDIFEEVTEEHRQAMRYLTQEAESIEPVGDRFQMR